MELKGKRITVVGIGESGRAAAQLLKNKGADVYATDNASSDKVKEAALELKRLGILVETGGHTAGFIKDSDLIVVSPGVGDASPAIKMATERSIPIISEIELAYRFCKAPIVAVTGTNGKSTIVTLIDIMLKASGKNSVLCGNIGEAFCGKLKELSADHIAVVEASSFQLRRIKEFKPKVAAITNITQNHFDWHIDFKEYFDSKKNIYRNQDKQDFAVLNYDDPNLRMLSDKPHSKTYLFSIHNKVEGAYRDADKLVFNINGKIFPICDIDEIRLRGEHNISNILCASLGAYAVGANIAGIKKVISEFEGLRHRFQEVCNIRGVRFIDDSKSTTIDSCRAALSSCREKVILIAGGRDKGSDFSVIREEISKKVKSLVLIGEAKAKIRDALKGAVEIYEARDMDEAVSLSWSMADKGGIIMLSPMCASFDMYKSYGERGDVFQAAVTNLAKTQAKITVR